MAGRLPRAEGPTAGVVSDPVASPPTRRLRVFLALEELLVLTTFRQWVCFPVDLSLGDSVPAVGSTQCPPGPQPQSTGLLAGRVAPHVSAVPLYVLSLSYGTPPGKVRAAL